MCVPISGRAQINSSPTVGICPVSTGVQQWGSLFDVTTNLSANIASNTGIAFTVSYDPLLLKYQGIVAPLVSIIQNTIDAGSQRIEFPNTGSYSAGPLCIFRFLALASSKDTITSTITIDSLSFNPPTALAERCATPVVIAPLCGMHGITYVGGSSIKGIHPNPLTEIGALEVYVKSSERSSATLRAYDIMGSVVRDWTAAIFSNPSEVTELSIDFRGLSTSLYTIVLQTATTHDVHQIMVVR
jgi:hypothetical protein